MYSTCARSPRNEFHNIEHFVLFALTAKARTISTGGGGGGGSGGGDSDVGGGDGGGAAVDADRLEFSDGKQSAH